MFVGFVLLRKKNKKKIFIGCKYIGVFGFDNKYILFDKGKK